MSNPPADCVGADQEPTLHIPGFGDRAPRSVFRAAAAGFAADDMVTYAAAVSYQMLLALFPFVTLLLAVLGSVGLAPYFDPLLEQTRQALPPEAHRLLAQVVGEVRGQSRAGLLSSSVLLAVWATSAGLRSVTNALNAAHGLAETRPVRQRWPLSVAYAGVFAGLVLAGLGLLLLGPRASAWVAARVGGVVPVVLWSGLRWVIVVGLLLAGFAALYKIAPNAAWPVRHVTPGSVVGVGCWIAASLGFSAYAAHFGAYGTTYGSFGGIAVLLLYFFVSAAALLFGAELNAALHPAPDPEPGRRDAGGEPDAA